MHESYKKWLENECPKVFCNCGCNEQIIITKNHKNRGIPKHINYHKSRIHLIPKSYQKWLDDGQPKVYCGCGCGGEIIIQKFHKCYGIPEYIHGHHRRNKHHTKESIQKMSIVQSGKIISEKQKQILRICHIGKSAPKGAGSGKGCYYNSPLQGKIWLRSSYEITYAKYLDKYKILWYYEIETFDLDNNTYTPDFFLIKDNKFIEIKGYMREKSQLKIDEFLEKYNENFEILYKEDLIKLGCEL